MAAVVQPAQPVRALICAEDSTFEKALCYIPIIGIFNGFRNELSIARQIGETRSSFRLMALITVKNEFKVAAVVNSVVSIAAIVAGVALGFFALGNVAILTISFLTGYGGRTLYGIFQNQKTIEKLEHDPMISMGKIH